MDNLPGIVVMGASGRMGQMLIKTVFDSPPACKLVALWSGQVMIGWAVMQANAWAARRWVSRCPMTRWR